MVEKESVLHQMNRFAIQAEVRHNKQYVVSRDKALLETYLKEMSLIGRASNIETNKKPVKIK